MANHISTGAIPGHFLALFYPGARRVEITAPGVTGALVATREHVERGSVAIMEREPGAARLVSRFEFTDFADLAGAREARDALAAYCGGDRALALSHANLAAVLHTGWRPLVRLLAGGKGA